MPLPRCLLDTLLFLGMACRVLDALLPSLLLVLLFVLVLLLGVLLRLLLVLVLLLGMLLRLLLVLVLLLGMLLRLLLVLALLLGMLLRLLFVLVLLLGMLLRLLLVLFWLVLSLSVLCERRNSASQRQKHDCRPESYKCFHWCCLNCKSRRTSEG